jgi:hypothetical protein
VQNQARSENENDEKSGRNVELKGDLLGGQDNPRVIDQDEQRDPLNNTTRASSISTTVESSSERATENFMAKCWAMIFDQAPDGTLQASFKISSFCDCLAIRPIGPK